ncbi:MAG: OmpA family protein [Deltaproteobacteria bacterium]|nr:OmpA family protein [Deltaproteobacteria bacterium]
MIWRRFTWLWLSACMLFGLVALGCGHGEDEWQAKLKEVDDLKAQLQAERRAHQKTQGDYNDAKGKIEELSEQLKKAGVDVQTLNASLAEQRKALEEFKRRAEQLDAIRKRFELLKQKLDALTKLGLTVSVRNNRMVISMPGDVLFDSGKVDLKTEGKKIIGQVADVIRGDAQLNSRTFQVAGHTDNKPLQGGPYKDNWGLSVMRAREVLMYLISPAEKGGGALNPSKWSAVGYGDTDPIVGNDSPENMQKNRRVELVIMPNVEEMLDLKSLTSSP